MLQRGVLYFWTVKLLGFEGHFDMAILRMKRIMN